MLFDRAINGLLKKMRIPDELFYPGCLEERLNDYDDRGIL